MIGYVLRCPDKHYEVRTPAWYLSFRPSSSGKPECQVKKMQQANLVSMPTRIHLWHVHHSVRVGRPKKHKLSHIWNVGSCEMLGKETYPRANCKSLASIAWFTVVSSRHPSTPVFVNISTIDWYLWYLHSYNSYNSCSIRIYSHIFTIDQYGLVSDST